MGYFRYCSRSKLGGSIEIKKISYFTLAPTHLSPSECDSRSPRPSSELHVDEPDRGQPAGGVPRGLRVGPAPGVPHGGLLAPRPHAPRQHHGEESAADGQGAAPGHLALPQGLRVLAQGEVKERHLRRLHTQDGREADRSDTVQL